MLAPVVALVLSLLAPLILLPFLGGQGLVDMPGKRRATVSPPYVVVASGLPSPFLSVCSPTFSC